MSPTLASDNSNLNACLVKDFSFCFNLTLYQISELQLLSFDKNQALSYLVSLPRNYMFGIRYVIAGECIIV